LLDGWVFLVLKERRDERMAAIDINKTDNKLYQTSQEPVLIDVPEMRFIAVVSVGRPQYKAPYQTALEALYDIVYAVK
jgi:hypothetical protein